MKALAAAVAVTAISAAVALQEPAVPANAASAQPLVTVYEHINRGGQSYSYYQGHIAYSTVQGTLGIANDSISSIEVHTNVYVTLYEHDWSGGDLRPSREMFFPKGFYNLTDYGFNDLTSRVYIWLGGQYGGPGLGTASLHIDINEDWGWQSHGWASLWLEDNSTDLTKEFASNGQNWNDKISCVIVPNGKTVTLYEHINYQGRSITFSTGVYNLTDYIMTGTTTWNDQASSWRIN